jgi:transcription elongation factor GreA
MNVDFICFFKIFILYLYCYRKERSSKDRSFLFFNTSCYQIHEKIMSKISYYTQEGLDKLKAEVQELRTKGRAEIARQIAEARDKGDLSENAEYDAAKEAQGLLELKISKLEELLGNARLLDESNIDISKVSVLSKVRIKNKKTKAEMTYLLVAQEEADLKAGKISVDSPIGKGLLGKVVGDTAKIQVPAGEIEMEILEISR